MGAVLSHSTAGQEVKSGGRAASTWHNHAGTAAGVQAGLDSKEQWELRPTGQSKAAGRPRKELKGAHATLPLTCGGGPGSPAVGDVGWLLREGLG